MKQSFVFSRSGFQPIEGLIKSLVISVGLSLISHVQGARIHSFAGPFDVEFKTFGICAPEIWGDNGIKIYANPLYDRETKQQRFVGNWSMGFPFDNDVTMTGSMASWDSVSGWRPNAFKMTFGPVEYCFKTFAPKVLDSLLKSIEVPKLPIPPGFYKMNGTLEGGAIQKFPAFPYGLYRCDVILTETKRASHVMGCVRTIFNIIPKRT